MCSGATGSKLIESTRTSFAVFMISANRSERACGNFGTPRADVCNPFCDVAHFLPLRSDPLIAAAIYGTTFPAKPSTPLLPPPKGKKWPLIIFSHGVGTSRLMYSTFCGEMASQGYIVCAIEHRDGTSPCSTIVAKDGKSKTLNWLQWSDL